MLCAVPSVIDDPCISLTAWTIVEADRGEYHLVGDNVATGLGRVSSAIERYDPLLMQFVTSSGRAYLVTNKGPVSSDAWYAWEAWASFNGVQSWREVIDDYDTVVQALAATNSSLH